MNVEGVNSQLPKVYFAKVIEEKKQDDKAPTDQHNHNLIILVSRLRLGPSQPPCMGPEGHTSRGIQFHSLWRPMKLYFRIEGGEGYTEKLLFVAILEMSLIFFLSGF